MRCALSRDVGYQLVMIETFHGLGHVFSVEFPGQDRHDLADRENMTHQTKISTNPQ